MFFECRMTAEEIVELFQQHQRHLIDEEAKCLGDVFRFFEWNGCETQVPRE